MSILLTVKPARTRRIIAAALLLGWVISLMLPVFRGVGPSSQIAGSHDAMLGYVVLLTGWMGFYALQFGWFANLFVVPILLRCSLSSMSSSGISKAASQFSAMMLILIGIDAVLYCMLASLGRFESLGAGCYLWFVVLAGTIVLLVLRDPAPREN